MAGNMEAMLLGNDGDSSDDDIGNVGASATAPAPAATAAAPSKQSDYKARLKSLYSPANKVQPAQIQQRQTSQTHTSVPQTQQQSQQSQQNRIQQTSHHHQQPTSHMTRPNTQMSTTMMHIQSSSSNSRIQPPPHQLSAGQRKSSIAQSSVRPILTNRPADPFEPTPLTTMIGRHPGPAQSSHKPVVPQQAPSTMQATSMSHSSVPPVATSSNVRTAVSQHMMQATPVPHMKSTSHHPTPSHHPSTTMHIQTSHHQSSAHHSSNSNHHAHTRPKSEREAKRAKEQFLMFTRVLMKYLEQKDPQMHARAKEVIRECAEKNKKKEQGYESVTASMKTRLRATVGEQYWKRADSYLTHFQEMQRRKKLKDQNDKISQQNAARQQQQQQAAIQKQLEAQRARDRMKEKERAIKLKEENIRKQNAQKKKENEIRAQQMARIQEENKRRINNGKQSNGPPKRSAKGAQSTPVNTSHQPKPPEPVEDEPPREYNEFMEMVDQSINYNWMNAGLLLSEKADIDLSKEQQKLLYGELRPKITTDHRLRRGWNNRNLVSARNAWALIRLPELVRAIKANHPLTPVVADTSLPKRKISNVKLSWLNEDIAEQDRTLAVLSEATQIYVKQIIDRALKCARQRENLDGIRLWHMQHSGVKPPIGLRLGCDVTRQCALVAGNAALTVKRMEEALERKPAKECNLKNPDVLSEVTSMGDLACRPKLSEAADKAEHHAKRSFEISGGKNSISPFGRVPKQAKIMAQDFQIGMELSLHQPTRTLAFHFS